MSTAVAFDGTGIELERRSESGEENAAGLSPDLTAPHAADEFMGAELWVLPDGIHLAVESPETGAKATINLTDLAGNLPGAGEIFRQWSACYIERFARR